MKEQIEEMAKIILRADRANNVTGVCADYKTMPEEMSIEYGCSRVNAAIALYNAGYRKQEWISVEDRLPEDDGFVLLCTSKGAITKGHYEHKYGRWSGLNNRLTVTHWMPLPMPPKEKQND